MAPDTKGREPANSALGHAEFGSEVGSSKEDPTSHGDQPSEQHVLQPSLFSTPPSKQGDVFVGFDEAVSPDGDMSPSGEGSESPLDWMGGDSDGDKPKGGGNPSTSGSPATVRTSQRYMSKEGECLVLAGFDEAGRGALAGPVVVGCVSFDGLHDPDVRAAILDALDGLNDSKQVRPKNRERLYERIIELGVWAVGAASAREIDRIGIVPACRLAADRACRRLGRSFDLALCDRGLSPSDLPAGARQASFTKGDARSLHISAASILAKVTRDRLMSDLAERAPGYGLEQHKGYGTAAHRAALAQHGPTRFHRRTFLGGRSAENQSC